MRRFWPHPDREDSSLIPKWATQKALLGKGCLEQTARLIAAFRSQSSYGRDNCTRQCQVEFASFEVAMPGQRW